MALLLGVGLIPQASRGIPRRPLAFGAPRQIAAKVAAPKVWLVERQATVEIYSNGLRVDNAFVTYNRARAYRAFGRQGWSASAIETQPAGIVYHTTESRMAPLSRARIHACGATAAIYWLSSPRITSIIL